MSVTHLGASRIDGPAACASVLLVGELNPYGAQPQYALYHEPARASGHRLQSKILGVLPRQTYLPMWRTNLCTAVWDYAAATQRARALMAADSPWRTIVMLGVKVVTAFGRVPETRNARPAMFTRDIVAPVPGVEFTLVALPHPSGRNTIWNRTESVTTARELLSRVAPEIPWGEIDKQGDSQ